MNNDAKLRPLYIAKILHELTDEEHFLTTNQISEILETEYGTTSHRQTIKADIELLIQFGLDIQETRSTQNKYNLLGRDFEISELKLLIDAVLSSKFISKEHSIRLVEKISSLSGKHAASALKRNVSCEGRIKSENKKLYFIIDRFGESVEVIERKEHTFSIKASITLNSILYSWVFGFGGKVQIKSPSYAIMAYENMLADALKHIQKENESIF